MCWTRTGTAVGSSHEIIITRRHSRRDSLGDKRFKARGTLMTPFDPARSRRIVSAGAVLVLAVVVLGGLIWAARSQPPKEPAAESPPAETPQTETPETQAPPEVRRP